MDLATIIGLATAFALIIGSMLLGGSLSAFFNVPGLLIVVGGTFAAAFVNQRMSHVLGAFKVMMQAFFDKSVVMEDQIPVIIGLAQKARKEGLVALEGENIEDEFLARGVRLGVDGLSPDMIKATLTSELAALKRRHERGVLTPWEGGAPWRLYERWWWEEEEDKDRDERLARDGPIPPGVSSVRSQAARLC